MLFDQYQQGLQQEEDEELNELVLSFNTAEISIDWGDSQNWLTDDDEMDTEPDEDDYMDID